MGIERVHSAFIVYSGDFFTTEHTEHTEVTRSCLRARLPKPLIKNCF
jgi:hypothetical protein